MPPNLIVITGPVGAGKTTSMGALVELLSRRGERVGAIDLDSLRDFHPDDPDDPFHQGLGLANLAAIWPNFVARGIGWLVLSDAVERPDERADYERAAPGAHVIIVRLDVPLTQVHEQLRRRESGGSLDWHLSRSVELQAIMTERRIGDIVVSVDRHTPSEVAQLIVDALESSGLVHAGWA